MTESLTADDLRFRPPDLPAEEVAAFLLSHWGVRGSLDTLRGERDQNFHVTANDGREFVLKIASPLEDGSLIDFQVRALQHIQENNPDLPVPRQLFSIRDRPVEHLQAGNAEYAVRLLSYVPGVPLESFAPPGPRTARDIGRLQGRLCQTLRDFSHPAQTLFMPWDIMNDLVISPTLRSGYLPNEVANRCEDALHRLEHDALPRMHRLPDQVIHNDAHAGNVLCDPDHPETITGLIDFGDLVRRPIIVDLATSLSSLADRCSDFLTSASALVEGFTEETEIPADQQELLYDAVVARAILTVQLLAFRMRHTEPVGEMNSIDPSGSIAGLIKVLDIGADRFLQAIRP